MTTNGNIFLRHDSSRIEVVIAELLISEEVRLKFQVVSCNVIVIIIDSINSKAVAEIRYWVFELTRNADRLRISCSAHFMCYYI